MAKATVELHPEAVLEGTAAYAWYAKRSPEAALSFSREMDAAVQAIAEQPARWPKVPAWNEAIPPAAFPVCRSLSRPAWIGTCRLLRALLPETGILEGSMIGRRQNSSPGCWPMHFLSA